MKMSRIFIAVWLFCYLYSLFLFWEYPMFFVVLGTTNAMLLVALDVLHKEIVTKIEKEHKQAELLELKRAIFPT